MTKLLTSDIEILDKEGLISLRKQISSLIGRASKDEKVKLIQKCRDISELVKIKFPKTSKHKTSFTKLKNRIVVTCDNCNDKFDTSVKNKNPFAFCKACRKKRETDLVELILEDKIIVYSQKDVKKAEEDISKLEADVRLDLHGVLDLTESDIYVGDLTMVVSYVGKLTRTRTGAEKDIKERVNKLSLVF